MLQLDFSLLEQTPHLGLARTWDGVCLNSVECTRYFVGFVSVLALFYLFFIRTNPT